VATNLDIAQYHLSWVRYIHRNEFLGLKNLPLDTKIIFLSPTVTKILAILYYTGVAMAAILDIAQYHLHLGKMSLQK